MGVIEIYEYEHGEHPQAAVLVEDEIEINGMGSTWGASQSDHLPQEGGNHEVSICV